MPYSITTPIYYPNGEPHLGHVYTTVCADAVARYYRLVGENVFFLTGTDEHGIKMVKTAAEQQTTPAELAEKNSGVFRRTFAEFGISNDDFIRTSEARHKAGVSAIVEKLLASGDIYRGEYEGWYDEGQEEFITETEAAAADFKSKINGKPLVRYKESSYFFRLTKYVDAVTRAIESDTLQVRPSSRRNEILSKLKGWDQDLSISRSSLAWGIPMPSDPSHVVYVWIDALSNYVTALGYPEKTDRLEAFWPVDVHLIGKEILWFHAFYWPAMLLALGEKLPKRVYAHGWWTSGGQKMGKTLGNFIDLDKLRGIASSHGLDALRYYMLKAAPFGNDLDWNDADFASAYAELGNVLGNLLNRTLNMLKKYRDGVVPQVAEAGPEDVVVDGPLNAFAMQLAEAYAGTELQRCALLPIELARAANAYIDQTKPFTLAKDATKSARLDTVLSKMVRATQVALAGAIPVLPTKAVDGLRQLGIDTQGKTLADLLAPLPAGHRTGEPSVLFPRVEG